MENAPVSAPPGAAAVNPGPVPPEEQFWKRYSPHNEAPLSGVTSFGLHVLAILLMLLIAFVYSKLHLDDENKPVPVDVVRLDLEGGGGGAKNGSGPGPGGTEPSPMETGSATDENPKKDKPPPLDDLKLPPAKVEGIRTEFDNDPTALLIMKEGNAQINALAKLQDDVRQSLRKNVNPSAGRGGPGTGGGKDTGPGMGEGAGRGDGKAKLNQREKRVLRWAMTFNTLNGTDYANQLQGLGAIIALPIDAKRFRVIRNLKDASTGKEEDISSINRIYWVDDKPQSVHSLCTALQVPVPAFFVAFFPGTLETKLLQKELDFMQKRYGRRNEDEIHETKFDVVKTGANYDVTVRSVTLRHR